MRDSRAASRSQPAAPYHRRYTPSHLTSRNRNAPTQQSGQERRQANSSCHLTRERRFAASVRRIIL